MSARRSAFTLIELLVVISLISLLMAILLPALAKARRSAQNTQCAVRLRALGMASLMYAYDHKDSLPVVPIQNAVRDGRFALAAAGKMVVQSYLGVKHSNYATAALKCPVNPNGPTGASMPYLDYTYNGNIADYPIANAPSPWFNLTVARLQHCADRYRAKWPMFYDRISNGADTGTNWWRGLGSSNHLLKGKPEGGNVTWIDGSVKWEGYSGGAGWAEQIPDTEAPKAGIAIYASNGSGNGQGRLVGAKITAWRTDMTFSGTGREQFYSDF